MRYNIYENNYINYSEYKMSNGYRFIIDIFDNLMMCYTNTKPSKVLSTDPVIINRFRRKVLKRITERAEAKLEEATNEHRPDDIQ